MLPSRRLGRLAQLLVLSQRPGASSLPSVWRGMLPSRRLGRLAQLLVLSQQPRRFLSTKRVARHVLLPSRRLGCLVQLLAVESAAEALPLYRACGAAWASRLAPTRGGTAWVGSRGAALSHLLLRLLAYRLVQSSLCSSRHSPNPSALLRTAEASAAVRQRFAPSASVAAGTARHPALCLSPLRHAASPSASITL